MSRFQIIRDEWAFFDLDLNIRAAWYTRPCLEYLVERNWYAKRVFEFGAGASTLWWRALGAVNSGVDNNIQYIMPNIKYEPDPIKYVDSIKGLYDVIVIDGICRIKCFKESLKHLDKDGIIIVDNWEQSEFDIMPQEYLNNLNIKVFKQPDHKDWATAILWK